MHINVDNATANVKRLKFEFWKTRLEKYYKALGTYLLTTFAYNCEVSYEV